jgi:hypothetical protein
MVVLSDKESQGGQDNEEADGGLGQKLLKVHSLSS